MKQVRKAVIPAAGFGTRFLPITKGISKEMLPIIDIPTVELIIDEAVAAGIKEVILVIAEHKQDIINYFKRNPVYEKFVIKHHKENLIAVLRHSEKLVKISFAYQKEQKGLGHAILCAEKLVGQEPFAVLLGDDVVIGKTPAIGQLMACYQTHQCSVVGVQKVAKAVVNKYGVIAYTKHHDREYEVQDMVEKPDPKVAPSDKAILGRYVLTSEIFKVLKKQKPGVGGEIQLTDAIQALIAKEGVYAYEFEGRRYDVGTQLGYVELTLDQALTRADIAKDVKAYLKQKAKE